ncbi:hypothetical protein ACLOJK_035914 [Asimina triloba]
MTTNFGQWVKDPFFSAAEEVQESADRMESAYWLWLHGRRNDPVPGEDSDGLRRDLQTALGTTKWQLEEFERAVRSSYGHPSVDAARSRHRQFVTAISSQVSKVEKSLRQSEDEEGRTNLSWVRLDEGERDELAAFLSGPVGDEVGADAAASKDGDMAEAEAHCSTNSCRLAESGLEVKREVRSPGHRRTASADADARSWNITIPGGDGQQGSLNMPPAVPPPRIFSFSGTSESMESSYKQMPKNGFRKLKAGDRHHSAEMELLQGQTLSRVRNSYPVFRLSKDVLGTKDIILH